MDLGFVALMIPIMALCIPIIAIMVSPMKAKMAKEERAAARKIYERIVMEKLDVIKTAVAMGYSENDISDLDARLEKLIGQDQMGKMLEKDPGVPLAEAELRDADLDDEIARLKSMKRKQQL